MRLASTAEPLLISAVVTGLTRPPGKASASASVLRPTTMHAGVAERDRVDETRDLSGRRFTADADGPNGHLSFMEDRCGERGLADAARDRKTLASDRLLIDHRRIRR